MKKNLLAILLFAPLCAFATDATTCATNKGTYLTGTITTSAKFQAATQTIQGVQVSHTIMYIKADQDGRSYQVAMDNVYASDYREELDLDAALAGSPDRRQARRSLRPEVLGRQRHPLGAQQLQRHPDHLGPERFPEDRILERQRQRQPGTQPGLLLSVELSQPGKHCAAAAAVLYAQCC